MHLNEKNLSLRFYKLLCDLIGSQDVVKTRRNIFTGLDISQNNSSLSISSGSKAEGIDLKGSDFDLMLNINSIQVYESLNDVHYPPDKITLYIDTNDAKPGFAKLKLVNKLNNFYITCLINSWCEIVGDNMFISSKKFREFFLSDGMISHGPCVSTPNGEYDYANCFRCRKWITTAQQWIHRSRPGYTLVNSAVQYGVLFVPIGCKNSPNEDLQWRISFSVTEKLLIHSFSHTQLLCYALMKIILKDIIKQRHDDLLCSYFIKTIMFWLSEEISPSEWKPDSITSCFLKCLKRLVYCVEYQTCLHYFIPENNLFEDRFTDNEHKTLLTTLRCIYGSPWISLFNTITFQNFILESVNFRRMTLTASELSCITYISLLMYDAHSIHSLSKTFFYGYNYILKKEMCVYMLCVCFRKSIQTSDYLKLTDKNKSFYKQYKRTLCYFKISLHSDSISSWLFLASLLYKCKRFQECLDIINYSLSICTPDKIHLDIHNSMAEQTIFKEMKQRFGLLLTFKDLIIEDVCFFYPFCLLPDELKPAITSEIIHFPPVVYSYLLQFLCCYYLRDNSGKYNALHDLELTIRERYFISPFEGIFAIVNKSLDIVKTLI